MNLADPDEMLTDAIIFGTSIVKAQDKLLQTPKTLNLQQCLTVCRHYESLKMHIKQIRPNRSVDYLRRCHKKKGQGSQSSQSSQSGQERGSSQQSQNNMQKLGQFQSYQCQLTSPVQQKCFKCGLTRGTNQACPVIGQTCHQ